VRVSGGVQKTRHSSSYQRLALYRHAEILPPVDHGPGPSHRVRIGPLRGVPEGGEPNPSRRIAHTCRLNAGGAAKDLITIVTPRSFARWVGAADKTRKTGTAADAGGDAGTGCPDGQGQRREAGSCDSLLMRRLQLRLPPCASNAQTVRIPHGHPSSISPMPRNPLIARCLSVTTYGDISNLPFLGPTIALALGGQDSQVRTNADERS